MRSSSISKRLILYIVICSSVITLGLAIVQLNREYRIDLDIIENEIEQIKQVHIGAITRSLWATDTGSLEIILRGLSKIRDIKYLAVIENGDVLVSFGKRPEIETSIRSISLNYEHRGDLQKIGILVLAIDYDAVNQRLYERILVILISNFTKTTLVVIFMMLIFYQLVTRHLTSISTFLLKLEIGGSHRSLTLDRRQRPDAKPDELDLVVGSINQFLKDNEDHLIERKKIEQDLLTHNQITSNMVEAAILIRTSDASILYTNPAFETMFQYEPGEVIGKHVSILNAPTDVSPAEITEAIRRELNTHEIWRGEICNIRKNGEIFWSSVNISGFNHPVYGEVWVSVNSDSTERKQAEAKLTYQANYDALTGLVNRYEFERRVEHLISAMERNKGEHALCYMDLDQFKVVNDTCGHSAGDEMLRQLGQILQKNVRRSDTLARLGGDEFGVLMEHCSLDQAQRTAKVLLKKVEDFHFAWEGKSFRIGVSIGLVGITEITGNMTDLLKQADAACYMAKDLGRNRIHVYHPEDTELAERHGQMQWVAKINQALDENRFVLYAQDIVPLNDSGERHYELLLRMLDEQGNIVPPGAFLSAAERYGIVDKVDEWVINNAFALITSHTACIEQIELISINLSGQSLTNDKFLKSVIAQINEFEIDASKICFEITETAAITNLSAAGIFISTLKKYGCRFSLDDFGSGLSSFGYLKSLPVDYLKIDGIFVKDMVDDPIDFAMVKSINDIGHVMGMKTIAEFVENDEIKHKLIEIGVDYAQGYGIGKPRPFTDLLEADPSI